MSRVRVAATVLAVSLTVLAACSSGSDDGSSAASTSTTAARSTTTTVLPERPAGPAAEIVGELTGGAGVNVAAAAPPEAVLEAAGYEQHEYRVDGTATSYSADEYPADGRWTFTEADEADYRTRIVVRRPADPADFSGTVVVEWMNVSGGLDADPDWQLMHAELTRQGHIWVGVSTQVIGINGGPVAVVTPEAEAAGAGKGLRNLDPERYGELELPGDGYSFDIYTQLARALRDGGEVLGGGAPDHVLAIGESQSAFALVTYINGVQPLTEAFDGFFVHSRGATGLPLAAPGQPAGIADSLATSPTIVRTDSAVPVLEAQTESDVAGILSSVDARQDDTDRFRLWEVAGTAHADRQLVGERSDALGCGPINDGPMHLVVKAAIHALVAWVADGTAPPTADRLELTGGDDPAVARDDNGIALGGIRTPPVDVPVDVLSGEPGPDGGAIVCILSGSTTPLPDDVLAARYASRSEYQQRFEASADATVAAGFVLAADRGALLAYEQPDRIPA